MKQVIPATTVITCDICGSNKSFKCEATLKIKRHALDWNNYPVADGSTSFDLCDDCVVNIEVMLNNMKKPIKA